jgi:hypothetical protein
VLCSLTGGKRLREKKIINSIGRASTPCASLEHVSFGSIGITVFSRELLQICRALQAFKEESHLWQLSGTKRLYCPEPRDGGSACLVVGGVCDLVLKVWMCNSPF